jgi:uncharacterized protein (TIGR02145 family)
MTIDMIRQYAVIMVLVVFFCVENNAQNIECIDNYIEIPLPGYKAGDIQWQFSTDQSTWTDIENQNSTLLNIQIQETGYFRAMVTNLNCTYYSDTIYIQAFPQPTIADAGADQTFTNGTISTTLSANTPEAEHGTGQWSIVSGDGGSFDDDTSSTAVFTGQECKSYQLQWTITTSCNSSSDIVNITFNQIPTVADAGADQTFTDGTISTTLASNTPEAGNGTGQWSIVSGDGGSFDDDTSPTAVFTGTINETYYLRWTISTNCQISEDDVKIGFWQDEAGNQITDIDGNTYNTVWIGGQNWMAENLKTTKYTDGTDIPNITDNTEWENLSTGAYAWYDNDEATYGDTYGALYNWYVVETEKLCPSGWHVPTDEEWTTLTEYLGGADVAGGKLKETGTTHWFDPNEGATNESGFTALPGGYRFLTGDFGSIGDLGYWWSATKDGANFACNRIMFYNNSDVYIGINSKEFGLSVRCLRDY